MSAKAAPCVIYDQIEFLFRRFADGEGLVSTRTELLRQHTNITTDIVPDKIYTLHDQMIRVTSRGETASIGWRCPEDEPWHRELAEYLANLESRFDWAAARFGVLVHRLAPDLFYEGVAWDMKFSLAQAEYGLHAPYDLHLTLRSGPLEETFVRSWAWRFGFGNSGGVYPNVEGEPAWPALHAAIDAELDPLIKAYLASLDQDFAALRAKLVATPDWNQPV